VSVINKLSQNPSNRAIEPTSEIGITARYEVRSY